MSLHFQCRACTHCVHAHSLTPKSWTLFGAIEDPTLVLICGGCGEVCPAESRLSDRTATLAAMHTQAIVDTIEEVGL